MLTREAFFAVKPEVREVPIAALGGSVYVRNMSAGDRDRFEVDQLKRGGDDFRARLAALTACDAEGRLLFGPDDVAGLSAAPSHVLDAVVKAAIELNRMDPEDVKELEKN